MVKFNYFSLVTTFFSVSVGKATNVVTKLFARDALDHNLIQPVDLIQPARGFPMYARSADWQGYLWGTGHARARSLSLVTKVGNYVLSQAT